MKITLSVLAAGLSGRFKVLSVNTSGTENITGAGMYDLVKKEFIPGFVYVAKDCIPDLPNECCSIIIGSLEIFPAKKCILISDDADPYDVWEYVSALINRLIQGYQKMLHAVMKGVRLQEFVGIFNTIIRSPLVIFDECLKVLASIEGTNCYDSPFYINISGRRYLNVQKLLDFHGQNRMDDVWNSTVSIRKTMKLSFPPLPRSYIVNNAYCGSEYLATIVIVDEDNKFDHMLFPLVDIFAECVGKIIKSEKLQINRGCNSDEAFYEKVLRGEFQDKDTIIRALTFRGINPETPCRVCVIKNRSNKCHYYNRILYCSQILSKLLNKSSVVPIDNEIVVVTIYHGQKSYDDKVISQFLDILEKHDLVCGVSNICQDFFSLREYYKQASFVAGLEWWSDTCSRIRKYENAISHHVIAEFARYNEVKACIHPLISLLIEWDRANGTDYMNILDVYLSCDRNVSACSKELFIHRTTMYYYIDKIFSIIGDVDLDDAKLRFDLLLSIKLSRFAALSENASSIS